MSTSSNSGTRWEEDAERLLDITNYCLETTGYHPIHPGLPNFEHAEYIGYACDGHFIIQV